MAILRRVQTWMTSMFRRPKPTEKQQRFDYRRDFKYTPGKHIQEFRNDSAEPLGVWIELYPDYYLLQPGDEMTVIYDMDLNWPGLGLTTVVTAGGELQIYLQEFDSAIILINGQLAEPM